MTSSAVGMSALVSCSRKRSAVGNVSGVMLTSDYSGYEPPAGIHHLTDRISPELAPEEFFSEYVAKRRPVVFSGLLTDDQWKGDQWTVPYLLHKAGTAAIMVEDRPKSVDSHCDLNASFQEMQYREFVSSLVDGETRYQLTNSDVQCSMSDLRDRNGFLSTVLQPLQTVADEFPLRPTILGNLIPHQVTV